MADDELSDEEETEMFTQSVLESMSSSKTVSGRPRTIADLEKAEKHLHQKLLHLFDEENTRKLTAVQLETEAVLLRQELSSIRERLEQERTNSTRRN